MKMTIIKLLTEALSPETLEVMDNSSQHAGHNPAAKVGGTHFEVKIVAVAFTGKSRVQRHRMVYKILEGPLKTQVHALAITALTPNETIQRE